MVESARMEQPSGKLLHFLCFCFTFCESHYLCVTIHTHTLYNTKHTLIRSFPFHGKARWSSWAFFWSKHTHTEGYLFIFFPNVHHATISSLQRWCHCFWGWFHLSDSDLPVLCDLFSLHRGFLWLMLSKSSDLVHLAPRHRLTESHAYNLQYTPCVFYKRRPPELFPLLFIPSKQIFWSV